MSANGEIKASCFCSDENKTDISLDTRRCGYALKDKSGVWDIFICVLAQYAASGVNCLAAQLFFYAKQLVVFSETV